MRIVRVLVTVAVGCGLLLAAPAAAHATVGRAAGDCDGLQSLHEDLGDLESSSTFDADGYAQLAEDFSAAAKDAPAPLRSSLKRSAGFYKKVSQSKTEKAAIALYLKGLKKYKADFRALDDYLAEECATTRTTS